MNSNSSRFGKYLELGIDSDFRIAGANISDYLLEKSRVAQQADGERNFHMFYYMLEGSKLKRALGLKHPVAGYRYLGGQPPPDGGPTAATKFKRLSEELEARPSGMGKRGKSSKYGSKFAKASARLNSTRSVRMPAKPEPIASPEAKAEFEAVTASMTQLGFTETEQDEVIQILAGVLHMGNIGYTEATTQTDMPGFAAYEPVNSVGGVLGVSQVLLGNALRSHVQVTRGETILRVLSVAQAEDVRDATAKALYGRMFAWIVSRADTFLSANASSSPKSSGSGGVPTDLKVGVLDIFGFENFDVNSFEHLCTSVPISVCSFLRLPSSLFFFLYVRLVFKTLNIYIYVCVYFLFWWSVFQHLLCLYYDI